MYIDFTTNKYATKSLCFPHENSFFFVHCLEGWIRLFVLDATCPLRNSSRSRVLFVILTILSLRGEIRNDIPARDNSGAREAPGACDPSNSQSETKRRDETLTEFSTAELEPATPNDLALLRIASKPRPRLAFSSASAAACDELRASSSYSGFCTFFSIPFSAERFALRN